MSFARYGRSRTREYCRCRTRDGWAHKLKRPFELLRFRSRGTLLPLLPSVREAFLQEQTFAEHDTHLLVLFDEGVRLLGLSEHEARLHENLRAPPKRKGARDCRKMASPTLELLVTHYT